MSESTENTTPTLCEQVLDYAYDELAGDAKTAFEQHLQTCARCQAELASFKKVRGAVKAVLPSVEPPSNTTGALHAQLLHAAAQRSAAAGGKVIPFGRRVQKVMMSPAFLAAAMFVLIGGAAGTMWWRGHVMLPAPEATAEAPLTPPPPPPAPPAVATATPSEKATAADETTVKTELPKAEADRSKSGEKAKETSGYYKDVLAKEGGEAENKVFLDVPGKGASPMPVHRAPPAAHAGKVSAEKPEFAAGFDKPADVKESLPTKKKMAPAEPASVMKTRKMDNAALGDLDGLSDDSNREGGVVGGVVGGMPASTGGARGATVDTRTRRDQPAKPSAPSVRPASKSAKNEAPAAAPQGGGWNGNVSAIPPQGSSAPAAPQANSKAPAADRGVAPTTAPVEQQLDGRAAGVKSSTSASTWRNTTQTKQQSQSVGLASPSAQQAPAQGIYGRYDLARKQALDYADAGRCPDAVKLFEQMQKDRWSLSAKEQAAYKRCKAKLDEASKQDKNFQNRMLQDAERVHEENTQQAPARMATPKPAPAAPPQAESQAVKAPAKGKKKAADAPAVSDPAEAKPSL